jgi:hypothetical protein
MNEMKMNMNEDVVNYTFFVRNENDGILLNTSMDLKKPMQKIVMNVKINMPEDETDQDYRRELFKTTVDWQKILKAMDGSFMAKLILDNVKTAANFKMTFPMKEGIYTWTNITVTDKYFPFPISSKLLIELRTIGKIVGKKASVHLYTFKMRVMIRK